DPGMGEPGASDPGMSDPGMGEPGAGDPGMGEPGMGEPGMGDPGAGPEDPAGGEDFGVPAYFSRFMSSEHALTAAIDAAFKVVEAQVDEVLLLERAALGQTVDHVPVDLRRPLPHVAGLDPRQLHAPRVVGALLEVDPLDAHVEPLDDVVEELVDALGQRGRRG